MIFNTEMRIKGDKKNLIGKGESEWKKIPRLLLSLENNNLAE